MPRSSRLPLVYFAAPAGECAFLVASSSGGADVPAICGRAYQEIARALRERGLTIVHERVFGSLCCEADVRAARRSALEAHGILNEGPLTYVQGRPPTADGWGGTIIHAVSTASLDAEVQIIEDGDAPCGRRWQRHGATYLVLQGLEDPEAATARSRAIQTTRLIKRASRLLWEQGVSYRDVVRTWFYLADILDWYGEFNGARTTVYRELALISQEAGRSPQIPASTGIGAVGCSGAAAVLDLLAVKAPPDSPVRVVPMRNPCQQEAFQYGSAFSRGQAIHEPDATVIQISGTAAVDQAGRSLYPRDARAQIQGTLASVAVLLGQEQAALRDIVAGTAFVKRPEDVEVFRDVLAGLGLTDLPVVCVVADVCREELLFELDAEAVVVRKP